MIVQRGPKRSDDRVLTFLRGGVSSEGDTAVLDPLLQGKFGDQQRPIEQRTHGCHEKAAADAQSGGHRQSRKRRE